jgi:hypothetical protein
MTKYCRGKWRSLKMLITNSRTGLVAYNQLAKKLLLKIDIIGKSRFVE